MISKAQVSVYEWMLSRPGMITWVKTLSEQDKVQLEYIEENYSALKALYMKEGDDN